MKQNNLQHTFDSKTVFTFFQIGMKSGRFHSGSSSFFEPDFILPEPTDEDK